jgi:hypothetical protein
MADFTGKRMPAMRAIGIGAAMGLAAVAASAVAAAPNVFQLNPKWVPYSGAQMPDAAVSGGFERGHPFPVCRAFHAGMQLPGKFLDGHCNVSYGGGGFSVAPPFEMLTGSTYPNVSFWIKARPPDPANIVTAATDAGQPVAVCVGERADGTAHAGKLVNGACYFEYGGHEEQAAKFQWLAQHTYP